MVERSEIAPGTQDWWSQAFLPIRRFGERMAEFFTPHSEAMTSEQAYQVVVELPGVAESDISVEVADGRLVIAGEKKSTREEEGENYYFSERSFGHFSRSFRLPEDADQEAIEAKLSDGVLTIRIAKQGLTASAARKIEISTN